MATKPSVAVSYTTASNDLSIYFSELPEYVSINRSVSAVSTGGGDQKGDKKSEGAINTGYIPNWISLLNTDKKKVIYESKRRD